MKNLSTRDVLLKLRQIVDEDKGREDRICELTAQLNTEIGRRFSALTNALGTLESYADFQARLHGFNPTLDALVVELRDKSGPKDTTSADIPVKLRKASKKVAASKPNKKRVVKKRKTRSHTGRNGGPQTALGYPGAISSGILLSEKEQDLVDILTASWPVFTTPQTLVRHGVVPHPGHVTCKVNQLRRKGVPIESARQARLGDASLSVKARGYRLIG